jgi:hypothetical protein
MVMRVLVLVLVIGRGRMLFGVGFLQITAVSTPTFGQRQARIRLGQRARIAFTVPFTAAALIPAARFRENTAAYRARTQARVRVSR